MQAQNVIPEFALIENLSPHWRERFEKALEYLFDRLDQIPPPSWDEVASHCAISPQHFHRMFHSVFNEPPGQYLRRLRLQEAVHLLMSNDSGSITDVAFATGFSSSQALAKALRRDLGTNAKSIRKMGNDPKLEGLSELLGRLGHPDVADAENRDSLEVKMAKQLTFDICSYPERRVSGRLFKTPSWEQLAAVGERQVSNELVMLTQVEHLDRATLNDFEMIVGEWSESSVSNVGVTTLAAGEYLTCTASLDSELAYFAVWDEFDRYLLLHDLDVPAESYTVEIAHDSSTMMNDVSVMTFQMLVTPVV
mgnify:CR=1 FL=1